MPLAEFSKADHDPRRLRVVGEGEPGLDHAEEQGGLLIAEPRPPAPWLLGMLLITAIAIGLFLMLNGRRIQRTEPVFAPTQAVEQKAVSAIPELPADLGLSEPPEPARPPPEPAPPRLPRPLQPPPLPFPAVAPQPARSYTTPALIVDLGQQAAASAPSVLGRTGSSLVGNAPAGPVPSNRVGGLEALALGSGEESANRVTATRLRNPSGVVPRGAVIPAVLETAIDSDLPGYARAMVSRDVLSFDGSNVLIPRGSRLIGRYNSDLVPGQSRVFVVWTSVIRPDGASIELSSPATDDLGRGGLEGRVDRRFFERYGGSLLMTTLNAGLNALSAARSQITIAGGGIGTAPAGGAVGKPIGPVVKVRQGTRIRVFVARELDFSTVGGVSLNSPGPKP